MADIKLENINVSALSGSELFNDTENFAIEFSDDSDQIIGARQPLCCPETKIINTYTITCDGTW